MTQTLSEISLVVLHTFVIYIFLILTMSLLGHRQTSQLSIVELVVLMMLGSSVETAMVAGNTSLLAGLAAAGTLLITNRLFSLMLENWVWLRRFIMGRPIPLIFNGKILPHRTREAGLTEDDLFEGMRERGYTDLAQIRLAVLETDGTISVISRDSD